MVDFRQIKAKTEFCLIVTVKQPSLQTVFTVLDLQETEKQYLIFCEPNPIKRRRKLGILTIINIIITFIIYYNPFL